MRLLRVVCCALLAGLAHGGWVIAARAAADHAEAAGKGVVVRGLAGAVTGGFRESWFTHLGNVPLFGARQNGSFVEWKSAPLPPRLEGDSVTFVWSGALGAGPARGTNFSLSVNGRKVARLDVSLGSVEFPCLADGCRLLYRSLFTYGTSDSSGHFFLTVPAGWVTPGETAALRVDGRDVGAHTWFALIRADDASLDVPRRRWKPFVAARLEPPGTPPPRGQEASYEWYVGQYPDPVIFTAIGPEGDPGEAGVSPRGQLMQGKLGYSEEDGTLGGTPFVANALAFGLLDEGRFVTVGVGEPASQSLWKGRFPIVLTDWSHGNFDLRETAFARPLRGDGYTNGAEATLAWAVFDITNTGPVSRELAFVAAFAGDEKEPQRRLTFRESAVFDGESALFAVRGPEGFKTEFVPVLRAGGNASAGGLDLLRSGGAFNAVVVRGECPAGASVRIAAGRVFQFPGTRHWGPSPVRVAAGELTRPDPEGEFAKAQAAWEACARKFTVLETPDPMLDRIVGHGMLDGYFLTKRWEGKAIVFDSVCYRCQWDDASMKWVYALDLMGDHATAARLLETVFARQGQRKPAGASSAEGCFSDVTNIERDGSDASWASCNGWALWAMAQHARLANDRAWLAAHKPQILAGCDWIVRERRLSQREPGNPCAGLIHGKFVCDMPDNGPVKGIGYFTYTDAISYLGLQMMADLLNAWGHAEGKALLAEAGAYRKDIIAAVDRATDRSRDPWFVPWALHAPRAEHKYLNGVCGPINLAYAGVLSRDDERVGHVIRWNLAHDNGGSVEQSAVANMFYSQDLAITLLEQGRVEEFLRMLYCILGANVTHETLSTCEWRRNTQPHVHSISSLVRMVRTLLVQERDGALVLLQGTPRRWLERGKTIRFQDAPTWYGPLSLEATTAAAGTGVSLRLQLPERLGSTPVRLRLRLPLGRKIERVASEKQGIVVEGEWIEFAGLSGQVAMEVSVAGEEGK